MNFTQIKETCLYFHDLQKAKDFYGGKLELAIISDVHGKHVFFRVGSSVLLCFNPDDSRQKKSPPGHSGSGKIHFALEVKQEEYEAHKDKIRLLGIPIIDAVIWDTGQESFHFEDPEGHLLEIVPEGIWR